MRLRVLLAAIVCLFVCIECAQAADVIVYDAAENFLTGDNPNGAWTYGYYDSNLPLSADSFTAFEYKTDWGYRDAAAANLITWQRSHDLTDPAFVFNQSASVVSAFGYSWQPGKLAMDSWSNPPYITPVLRWQAPQSGLVDISAMFTDMGVPNYNTAEILGNSFTVFWSGVATGGVSYSSPSSLYVNEGECIYFRKIGGGISQLDATVSLTPSLPPPVVPQQPWTIGKPIVTYFSGPNIYDLTALQMAEGGWNLCNVFANSIPQMDAAQVRGMRVMWYGPLDDATVNSIKNHPALYTYFVRDEPSASEFSSLASTVSRLRTLDPSHMAYINLYPNYATNSQLGTSNYSDYINQYMSTVRPSLLSYDHYQFHAKSDGPDYLANLEIISHAAKQAGIPFVNVIQASSWDSSMRVPGVDEMRYLYYSSLAYGAQGISHYVYYADEHAGGMCDAYVVPTPLYTAVTPLNYEFVAIAQQLQSKNYIDTYLKGYSTTWKYNGPPGTTTLPSNAPFSVSNVPDISYSDGDPLKGVLLGFFDKDGTALSDATIALVVNLNYSSTFDTRVTGPGGNLSVFDPALGVWVAQGHPWADVSLARGGGVLVGLTSVVPEPSVLVLLSITAGLSCFAWRRRLY